MRTSSITSYPVSNAGRSLIPFTTVIAVYAAEGSGWKEKVSSSKDDVIRVRRAIDGTTTAAPSNSSIESVVQTVGKQLSQILSFINRDSVARFILALDQVYGNASTILLVVNQVLNLSSLLLSAVPFGAIMPLVLQAGFAVLLSPPGQFVVKFLLFRLWEALPAHAGDQYSVHQDNLNIVVRGQNGETNEIMGQTTARPLFPFFPGRK